MPDQRSQSIAETGRIPRQVFYKIPYDPNGPSRSEIRAMLALDDLSNVLSQTENIKGYLRSVTRSRTIWVIS